MHWKQALAIYVHIINFFLYGRQSNWQTSVRDCCSSERVDDLGSQTRLERGDCESLRSVPTGCTKCHINNHCTIFMLLDTVKQVQSCSSDIQSVARWGTTLPWSASPSRDLPGWFDEHSGLPAATVLWYHPSNCQLLAAEPSRLLLHIIRTGLPNDVICVDLLLTYRRLLKRFYFNNPIRTLLLDITWH